MPKINLISSGERRHTQAGVQSGDPAIGKPIYPESPAVTTIAQAVTVRLERDEREAALRDAMAASAELLRTPTDALRFDLRERVFKPFSTRGVSYQDSDFECVDYEQYELAANLPMFRGPAAPRTALARGEYFCVIGAAQTFGRLVRDPWPTLMSRSLGLPVVNLSGGGVGPELFLEPGLVQLARNARFVVLQVMSGRSVGCEDYPGGRLIQRDSKPKLNRLDLLKSLWSESPETAIRYVQRWNASYLDFYGQLRTAIDRPTLLLWVSDRLPRRWKPKKLLKRPFAGSFPHLVGAKLFEAVAALFDERFEYLTGPISEQPVSRITNEPCPYFGDGGKALHSEQVYYPTSENHKALAKALTPWAETVLKSSQSPSGIRAHRLPEDAHGDLDRG